MNKRMDQWLCNSKSYFNTQIMTVPTSLDALYFILLLEVMNRITSIFNTSHNREKLCDQLETVGSNMCVPCPLYYML